MMKTKEIFFIGLMLFSMFFGAGNLIFPPFLGMEAGTSFVPAIIGFIVTGVGLPFLVLAAVSLVKGGAQELAGRVHPLFGTFFIAVVYLSIGPFLAIPRNANVAFEMSVKSFTGASSTATLFVFSIVFFSLVYAVSLNPSKMVNYMGRFITPTLLVAIGVLCVVALSHLDGSLSAPTEKYETGAFFRGFIEGYATMDALAALAFGIVILSAIHSQGVTEKRAVMKYTLASGLVAGAALAFVYVAIGFTGAKMGTVGTFENGTAILAKTASTFLGFGGTVLLGIIFTLACFTTCVGLTTACGHYFESISPKLTYRTVVTVVTLVSLLVANMGLNQIISVSIPFLVTAYPLTIVLVILSFMTKKRKVYASSMLLTGIVALCDGLKAFGVSLSGLQPLFDALPFSSLGLSWVVPAIFGACIGLIWDQTKPTHTPPVSKAA
ncbi:branched-chain amino acid transport system II carrier protein [Ectobacillus sp. JY-23]|uniref:branched-chain amino acid transport system II carrier protein n=1 Tax=Ectobacillus sp. JY-23 TaxID=2933872 RepID=UPI0034A048B9